MKAYTIYDKVTGQALRHGRCESLFWNLAHNPDTEVQVPGSTYQTHYWDVELEELVPIETAGAMISTSEGPDQVGDRHTAYMMPGFPAGSEFTITGVPGVTTVTDEAECITLRPLSPGVYSILVRHPKRADVNLTLTVPE